jgi:hypothetical protein
MGSRRILTPETYCGAELYVTQFLGDVLSDVVACPFFNVIIEYSIEPVLSPKEFGYFTITSIVEPSNEPVYMRYAALTLNLKTPDPLQSAHRRPNKLCKFHPSSFGEGPTWTRPSSCINTRVPEGKRNEPLPSGES